MHETPVPARNRSAAAALTKLDSWKAIADYLKRDVSTVRRWEKREGLPVHRHIHQKLGSVYAYQAEINDWLKDRGNFEVSEAHASPDAAGHDPGKTVARRVALRWFVALAGVVGLSTVWHGLPGARHGSPSTIQMPFVAVLPFTDGPGQPVEDVFVDGLTEGIIDSLSAVPGVKVISRMSAFRYKGRDIVPRHVGRELGGIDALLLGRARHHGDRITLDVELIDARDDRQLWSNSYERQQADSSAFLRDAVVRDVVRMLTNRAYIDRNRRNASNAEVYELYLRGRHHWFKRTPEGFNRAIAAFTRAIEQDPEFAPAYAGLADAYTLMGYFAYLIPFEEARSKAKQAALEALALDDSLAEAHTSMASVMEFERWDWAGAEREYRRAIQLAPNYATAYHWYANNLSIRGRHDEAISQASRAVELDPLSPILHVAAAHAYLLAGREDEAIRQLGKALEIEPSYASAHLFLGMAYERKGRFDEALTEMVKADALIENWLWKAFLADLYVRMQRPDDAWQIVRAFEKRQPNVSRVTTAAIYAAVRERERPMALLEQACDARDPDVGFLKSIPAFDKLRDEQAFRTLLERIGLS
jgi:TolB-like protein